MPFILNTAHLEETLLPTTTLPHVHSDSCAFLPLLINSYQHFYNGKLTAVLSLIFIN